MSFIMVEALRYEINRDLNKFTIYPDKISRIIIPDTVIDKIETVLITNPPSDQEDGRTFKLDEPIYVDMYNSFSERGMPILVKITLRSQNGQCPYVIFTNDDIRDIFNKLAR